MSRILSTGGDVPGPGGVCLVLRDVPGPRGVPAPNGVPSPGGACSQAGRVPTPRQVPAPRGGLLPGVPGGDPPATAAGSTHPTGMHSCFKWYHIQATNQGKVRQRDGYNTIVQ